jgi:hypothetical protein
MHEHHTVRFIGANNEACEEKAHGLTFDPTGLGYTAYRHVPNVVGRRKVTVWRPYARILEVTQLAAEVAA